MIPIVLELGSREEKDALGFNELGAKTIYFARAQAWEGDAAGAGSCPDEALAEIIEESVEKWKVVRDDLSTPRDHPLSGAKGDDGENLARRASTDRRIVLQTTQPLTQRLVVRRDPADAQAGQGEDLRHDAEARSAASEVHGGREPLCLVELEVAVHLVREQRDASRFRGRR